VSRRALWITIGAVAAVAVVAAVVLVWVLAPRASADDQALAYLHALADGDVAAVEATGLDVPETAAAAFVDADEHLSAGAIESSTADEHTAVVIVSYELAGTRQESTLEFAQRDGRWVPDAATGLGSVRFAVPVSIGDIMLPAEGAALLPAAYEVAAAPAEFLDGGATIEVHPGSAQEVDIEAALRPEATASAQAQLDDHLETCTAPAARTPSSCGIVIPWAADLAAVSEIRYRIEKSPEIVLSPTEFHADGGVLVATVAGTAPDGSAKSLTYRTTDWSVRGDVTFTGDDIVLSVW